MDTIVAEPLNPRDGFNWYAFDVLEPWAYALPANIAQGVPS